MTNLNFDEYNDIRDKAESLFLKEWELPSFAEEIKSHLKSSRVAFRGLPEYTEKTVFENPRDAWLIPWFHHHALQFKGDPKELYLNVFRINFNKDWLSKYDKEHRQDVPIRALNTVGSDIAEQEEFFLWKLLWPAGASQNVVKTDPNYEAMHEEAHKRGKKLTKIIHAQQNIRPGQMYVPEIAHGEKFYIYPYNYNAAENKPINQCGLTKLSTYPFRADEYGNYFNHTVRESGLPQKLVIGLCENPKDYLKVSIAEDIKVFYDISMLQKGRSGFKGYYVAGFVCLDPTNVIMGEIIN